MCSFGRRVCAAPRPSDMRTTITSRRQGRAARLIVALAIAATSVGTDAAIPSAESPPRSEEHTSELQSLMRISYAVFCLKNTKENEQWTRRTDTESTHAV